MRKLREDNYSIGFIARKFGCHMNAVMHHTFDVVPERTRRNYCHLRSTKLNPAQVRRIRNLTIDKGVPSPQLASEYDVGETTILNIVRGVNYRWVSGKIMPKKGVIRILKPIDMPKERSKSELKTGPKPNSRKVKNGVLTKIAKERGVAVCTICRWVKKGRLKLKKSDYL